MQTMMPMMQQMMPMMQQMMQGGQGGMMDNMPMGNMPEASRVYMDAMKWAGR
ncbi:hypothetical protein [Mesorhizobium sp.]|uniref:hypothetical protein n=1 Tax=Mesorhizobium sp. TaxID=1871066 RepID=UPI0025C523C0|nr:hypothetical protein [Mesorhizobium sp.]